MYLDDEEACKLLEGPCGGDGECDVERFLAEELLAVVVQFSGADIRMEKWTMKLFGSSSVTVLLELFSRTFGSRAWY